MWKFNKRRISTRAVLPSFYLSALDRKTRYHSQYQLENTAPCSVSPEAVGGIERRDYLASNLYSLHKQWLLIGRERRHLRNSRRLQTSCTLTKSVPTKWKWLWWLFKWAAASRPVVLHTITDWSVTGHRWYRAAGPIWGARWDSNSALPPDTALLWYTEIYEKTRAEVSGNCLTNLQTSIQISRTTGKQSNSLAIADTLSERPNKVVIEAI